MPVYDNIEHIYNPATYKYTVSHDGNGGSAPSSVSSSVSSASNSVRVSVSLSRTTPKREGYRFLYYKRGDTTYQPGAVLGYTFTRNETSVTSNVITSANGTRTLRYTHSASNQNVSISVKAQWAINTYAVDFNANGGTDAPETVYKPYDQIIELPSETPVRDNYIFAGWSTTQDGEVEYRAGDTYEENVEVTLYAVWVLAAGILRSITDVNVEGTGTAIWSITQPTHTYALAITYEDAPSITIDNIAAETTSAQFTIPSSWYEYITDTPTIQATAKLTSFEGGLKVGESTMLFAVGVSDNVHATISSFTATPHSENELIEEWGIAVEGYSYATLVVSVTPAPYTTIASISFSGDEIEHSSAGDTSADTNVFPEDGTKTFTVIVTDSRGKQAIQNATLIVHEYTNPVITILVASRALQDGSLSDIDGTYLAVLTGYRYASVSGYNSVEVAQLDYKARDVNYWTTGASDVVSDEWTGPFGNVDISKPFDVRLTITDAVGNTFIAETSIQSCVGYAFGIKNDRVRFGGPVRMPGFECDMPAKFDSTVNVIGDSTFVGDVDFQGSVRGALTPTMSADLSEPGWYRIMTIEESASSIIDFTICVKRYGTDGETHKISYFMVSDTVARFSDEHSSGDDQLIDSIRKTNGGTQEDPICSIDIHYTGSYSNTVYVDYVISGNAKINELITINNFEAVDDAPDGETIARTYSFYKTTEGPIASEFSFSFSQSATVTVDKAIARGHFVGLNLRVKSGRSVSSGGYGAVCSGTFDGPWPAVDITVVGQIGSVVTALHLNSDGQFAVDRVTGTITTSQEWLYQFVYMIK